MAWSRVGGTDPKYRSKEHRDLREHYARRLRAGEVLMCTADECVMRSRAMTNPHGNDADGLHLGHEDDGVTYRGPQHRACNLHEAAVKANARSKKRKPRRWIA